MDRNHCPVCSGIGVQLGQEHAHKPDIATRNIRDLMRYRASLVRMRTGVKNRIHALLTRLNVKNAYSDLFGKAGRRYLKRLELSPLHRESLDGYLRLVDYLNSEMKRAEAQVAEAFRGSHEAQLLATIPGVGPVLALTIASEIDDIDRFHSAKHVSSYAGLVPSTSQSGAHAWHGKITKQGSAWLRWALIEAVIHAVRYQSPIKDSYARLKKRKGNKIARVAAARKLCTYIYHMLKEDKDYESVIRYLKSDLG
ncbi:MAG: IS110 family transposase [Actinomycetota bacterium]